MVSSVVNTKIAKKILPPIVYDLLNGLSKLKSAKAIKYENDILQKNVSLRDLHKGKRCFIVATGPSINSIDFKRLKNEECICISRAYLHPDYQIINPRYHIVNPITKAHPKVLPLALEWFWEIEKKVSTHTTLLLGLEDHQLIKSNNVFHEHQCFFGEYSRPIDSISIEGVDFAKPVITGQSTSILAIAWAIYMGFTEIYMLGIDHDWIVHNLKSEYENKHFYNEADCIMESKAMKNYKNEDKETLFWSLAQLWKDYRIVNNYAKSKDIQIINVTAGSLLDNLPVKNFETVVAKHLA